MAFIYERVAEKDWELYNSFNLIYDGKKLNANKYKAWTVDKERQIYLILLGGGAFEQPEIYAFIWKNQQIKVYISSKCIKNSDGQRTVHWNIENIVAPILLKPQKKMFIEDLKKAIDVYLNCNFIIDNIPEPNFYR